MYMQKCVCCCKPGTERNGSLDISMQSHYRSQTCISPDGNESQEVSPSDQGQGQTNKRLTVNFHTLE